MKTRIISGLIMAPLLIVLYFKGIPLMVASFLIGAVGIYELFEGFKKIDIHPNIFVAWGMLILLYVFGYPTLRKPEMFLAWIVCFVVKLQDVLRMGVRFSFASSWSSLASLIPSSSASSCLDQ